MSDPIGSTSWRNRNRHILAGIDPLLAGRTTKPGILLVGPGAVTRLIRPLLRDAVARSGFIRRLVGDLARYSDQLIRRLAFMPLVSLEATELGSVITTPHQLTVIDISRRVLDAVQRDLPEAQCQQVDLGITEPDGSFDVVIALNVVSRIPDGAAAMRHLVNVLKSDGILVVDNRSAGQWLDTDTFEELAPKIWRRVASGS